MKLDIKIESLINSEDPDNLFELLEEIAAGAFGQVYKGRYLPTNELVAVKICPVQHDQVPEDIILEVAILKECQHPNIVKICGSYIKGRELFIAMELCEGGTVTDIIKFQKAPLKEDELASVVYEILKGLAYLHKKSIIHRDIKGGNVLLTGTGCVKLVDFGVSAWCKDGRYAKTFIGTPYWMAPEVIDNAGELTPYDHKSDIWSTGILALELAECKPPLSDVNPMRALMHISRNPSPKLQNPESWSPSFSSFLSEALEKDHKVRKGAEELMQHEFFSAVRAGTTDGLTKEMVVRLKKLQQSASNAKKDNLVSEEEALLEEIAAIDPVQESEAHQADQEGLKEEKQSGPKEEKIKESAKKDNRKSIMIRPPAQPLKRNPATSYQQEREERKNLLDLKLFHYHAKLLSKLNESKEKELSKLRKHYLQQKEHCLIENDFVFQYFQQHEREITNLQLSNQVQTLKLVAEQQKKNQTTEPIQSILTQLSNLSTKKKKLHNLFAATSQYNTEPVPTTPKPVVVATVTKNNQPAVAAVTSPTQSSASNVFSSVFTTKATVSSPVRSSTFSSAHTKTPFSPVVTVKPSSSVTLVPSPTTSPVKPPVANPKLSMISAPRVTSAAASNKVEGLSHIDLGEFQQYLLSHPISKKFEMDIENQTAQDSLEIQLIEQKNKLGLEHRKQESECFLSNLRSSHSLSLNLLCARQLLEYECSECSFLVEKDFHLSVMKLDSDHLARLREKEEQFLKEHLAAEKKVKMKEFAHSQKKKDQAFEEQQRLLSKQKKGDKDYAKELERQKTEYQISQKKDLKKFVDSLQEKSRIDEEFVREYLNNQIEKKAVSASNIIKEKVNNHKDQAGEQLERFQKERSGLIAQFRKEFESAHQNLLENNLQLKRSQHADTLEQLLRQKNKWLKLMKTQHDQQLVFLRHYLGDEPSASASASVASPSPSVSLSSAQFGSEPVFPSTPSSSSSSSPDPTATLQARELSFRANFTRQIQREAQIQLSATHREQLEKIKLDFDKRIEERAAQLPNELAKMQESHAQQVTTVLAEYMNQVPPVPHVMPTSSLLLAFSNPSLKATLSQPTVNPTTIKWLLLTILNQAYPSAGYSINYQTTPAIPKKLAEVATGMGTQNFNQSILELLASYFKSRATEVVSEYLSSKAKTKKFLEASPNFVGYLTSFAKPLPPPLSEGIGIGGLAAAIAAGISLNNPHQSSSSPHNDFQSSSSQVFPVSPRKESVVSVISSSASAPAVPMRLSAAIVSPRASVSEHLISPRAQPNGQVQSQAHPQVVSPRQTVVVSSPKVSVVSPSSSKEITSSTPSTPSSSSASSSSSSKEITPPQKQVEKSSKSSPSLKGKNSKPKEESDDDDDEEDDDTSNTESDSDESSSSSEDAKNRWPTLTPSSKDEWPTLRP
eukprot:TRINITY_DN705_c1_g2_i1.p1 TRINITY_DN705_c1_g2~~TRINITY_DN705_c1_g2_i1.p1  ORF type:complete len:1406 (-),score=421.12 TRINITY_DN705_c1_g2_i1:138-4355(-)